MLRENLDELQQTVNLLQSDNHEEFFDISTRNKKYGRVDAMNGPVLLEKFVAPTTFDLGPMLTLCVDSLPSLNSQGRVLHYPIYHHDLR